MNPNNAANASNVDSRSTSSDRWLIYVVPLVTIVTLGGLSLFNLSRVERIQDLLIESQETLATLKDLSALVNEAETGQRGYLLTEDADYLEPYHRARFEIPANIERLKRQMEDDGDAAIEKVQKLGILIRDKLAEMDETVDLMEMNGQEEALTRVNNDQGKELMSQIAMLLQELEEHRISTVADLKADSDKAYFWAILTAVLAFLLTLASIAWGLLRVDRELTRRNQAELLTGQRLRQLRVMTDIVSRITAARDVYSVFGIALNEYRQLLGVREAIVRVGRGRNMRYEGSQPSSAKPRINDDFYRAAFKICDAIPGDDSAFYRSAEQLAEIPEVTRLPEWQRYQKQLHGLLTVPMIASSRGKIGRLLLVQKYDSPFDDGDLSISMQLAHAVAVAVENARLTEAANVAAQRKDEFLAMLGHELRNPLAGILTGSETLSHPDLNTEEAEEIRAMIRRQAGAMNDIVNDLLDVSRIARGKISLAPTEFDLVEAVQDIVQDFKGSLDRRKISLKIDTPDRVLPVKADRTRIGQCLTNLLHNACKFSPDHSSVEVAVHAFADDPNLIEVSVTDHGVGLSSKELEDVFDLFHQVGATIDRTAGGLGLGLPLARGIIEMHGGTLTAGSDGPGMGATFYMRLPLARDAKLGPKRNAAAEAHAEGSRLRILAIDDRADARLPIKVLLTKDGHEVLEAASALEGLEIAKAENPDVIICDIGLPGDMNGYDVAKHIRTEPKLSSVYLVALSGYSQESDRRQAAAAGFDYHVAKPIAYDALHHLLEHRPRFSFGSQVQEQESI